MNAVEIGEAVSALAAAPFDAVEFPFASLFFPQLKRTMPLGWRTPI